MDAYLRDHIEGMAARAMADTLPSDKKAAKRYGRDRSTTNRWRNHGKGSPVHGAIQYILSLDPVEAMRVASIMLAAARMRALADKTEAEIIALYQRVRLEEADHEHADRWLDCLPPSEWDWSKMADATGRDSGTDLLKEACERWFHVKRVPASRVVG